MPLFIDRFPFHCWMDQTRTPPLQYWSLVLPIIVTEPGLSAPPASAPYQYWVLDTGNTGEAFAWRHHLLTAGLDPDAGRSPGMIAVTSAVGGKEYLPIRDADLWLVSNLPAFQTVPWRLELHRGIPFRDVSALPDPQFHRPLIGLRALRRAGLRVELDFARDTLSIWTPGSPGHEP